MDKPRKQRSCAPLTFEGAIARLLDAVEIIKLRNYIKPHEKKLIQDAFALIDQPRKEPKSKADKRREDYRHFLKQVDSECGPVSVSVCALGLRKTVFGRMLEDRRLRLPMMVKKHKSDLEIPFLREVVQDLRDTPTGTEQEEEFLTGIDNQDNTQEIRDQIYSTSTSASDRTPAVSPEHLASESRAPELQSDPTEKPRAMQQGSLSGRVFALKHEDARAIVMSEQIASGVWMTEPYDMASLPFITIPITHEACVYFGAERQRIL
ncbi:hypothetical protein BDV33DRAFT_127907 [Aspergillus novoparasiticus]|uniref:Uncharacterized protein n=1 Tax=Aspergillus novoparasiticus TaxID=986946 RepID=A0A5N6E549_9EURO|nr:hypothetical protein BDV33DRAFT_127907 [Aspergillus novoparasiticus]